LALHRYEMTRLAVKDFPEFEISDLEVFRGGNTYTYETVQELKKEYPDDKFYFIIGTDTLFMMEKWKNFEYLFENLTLIVAEREGENTDKQYKKAEELKKKYKAKIKFMEEARYDISSTQVRASFKVTNPKYHIVPDCPAGVIQYAEENHLYDEFPLTEDEILCLLKMELKPKRIVHSLGVRDTAVELAEIHHLDANKARLAGLLHDCAKYLTTEEKLELCREYDFPVSDIELANPELLHAKAGSAYANKKYNINDQEILDAIYYHTTGKPAMDPISLVIFIADYIEPGRHHSDKLDSFRQIAKENLEKCAGLILEETLIYLNSRPGNQIKAVDPNTQRSYEYYKLFLEEK
jgi:nicotinate-nucleotide adenylyltransferase